MIDRKELISQPFSLYREDGLPIASDVYFLPNGLLSGIKLEAAHRWEIADGRLILKGGDGRLTGEFARGTPSTDEQYVFVGFLEAGQMSGESLRTVCSLIGQNRRLQDHRLRPEGLHPTESGKRAAVLVRAHILDQKVIDLLHLLENGRESFDIFLLFDRTNGQPQIDPEYTIWHSLQECNGIGLSQVRERLFWWCGDFPFYFAALAHPGYEYYIMVEYDVHFTARSANLIENLIPLLQSRQIDAVGTRLRLEDSQDDTLHGPCFAHFDTVYSYFFPFIALSKRALSYLFLFRKQEAAIGTAGDDILYCESFVPTALSSAGFRCVDLNTLLPHSYLNDLMILPNRILGTSISLADQFANFSAIIHPVYSDRDYLNRTLQSCATDSSIRSFIYQLSMGDFGQISSDIIQEYASYAQEKLLVIPDAVAAAPLSNEPGQLNIDQWYSAADSAVASILAEGWSVQEDWGVWGIGPFHRLEIGVPTTTATPLIVDLDVEAFVLDTIDGRPVAVLSDESVIEIVTFSQNIRRKTLTLSCLPSGASESSVRIELRPYQVAAPKDVLPANPDSRPLGVALHNIRIRSTDQT